MAEAKAENLDQMMALMKVAMMGTLSAWLMAAVTDDTSAAEMARQTVLRLVD